jgi:hypothetical protein
MKLWWVVGFAVFLQGYYCIHILFLGDSLDRHTVAEFCSEMGRHEEPWTNESLSYMGGIPGGTRCVLEEKNVTISLLRIFGSNSTEPYFHADQLVKGHNIRNTTERIQYGLRLYFSISFPYSLPDIIYLHTSMWDSHYLQHSPMKDVLQDITQDAHQRHLEHILQNHLRNLQLIQSIVHSSAAPNASIRLALRTSPYSTARVSPMHCINPHNNLLAAYNVLTRKLAKSLHVLVHDYDREVWSTVAGNFHRCDILRDHVHVSRFFAVNRARKLLGWQHSNYLLQESTIQADAPELKSWLFPTKNATCVHVRKKAYLITLEPFRHELYDALDTEGYANGLDSYLDALCAEGKVWFVSYVSAQNGDENDNVFTVRRHSGVTVSFLRYMRLGRGDLLHVSSADWERTQASYPVPGFFSESFRPRVYGSEHQNQYDSDNSRDIWRKQFVVRSYVHCHQHVDPPYLLPHKSDNSQSASKDEIEQNDIQVMQYHLIADVHKHRISLHNATHHWTEFPPVTSLIAHALQLTAPSLPDGGMEKMKRSQEWGRLRQAESTLGVLHIDMCFLEYISLGRDWILQG